jgi:hypothetical protein
VTEKTIYIIDKNLIKYQKKISTRLLRRTKKSIKKYRSKKKQKYIKRHKSKKKHISKKKQKCKKKRIYISKYISKIKNKKIKKYKKNKKNILRYYSKILCIRKKNKKNLFHFFLDKKQTILLKKFEDVLLGSLSLYTKEKTNIFIKLQNLNKFKHLSYNQIKNCKIVFKQLKKFTRNSFYKEAINTILISVSKRKSAKLLAEYISYQFRLNQIRSDQVAISRKDNYFLGFLKQSIKLLINTKISRLTGAKIVIKGRFNRAPRAKKIIMQFGKFSLQSIKSKIDYYKSTAYTINGTFGIKI